MRRHLSASRSMAKAVMGGNVKYMVFHVTSRCNARCRMCFNWEGMQRRKDVAGPSLEDVRRLASSMRALPQLTLSGGEPLLRKDLPQIIQLFYENAQTRFFTVPSNSLSPGRIENLIDEFTTHCPDAFLNFCLPFHGDADHYDDIMGVPGNFVKFNESFAIVKRKKLEHPNISCVLNFVMSKFNYTRYREIIDLALAEYPEGSLGIAYCRGETHEEDATDVPIEVYREAHRYLRERRRAHATANPYTIMFDTIGSRMAERIEAVVSGSLTDLRCGAGRRFVAVFDNGEVFPCEMLDAVGIPEAVSEEERHKRPDTPCLGNLRDYDYDMRALLASDTARNAIAWLDGHACACTWECAVYSRILHDPAEWLGMARGAGRALAGGGRS